MEDEIKIVYKKVSELKPSGYNPKKCSPKEEADIESSIREFGIIDPIIVNVNEDRKNIIVGGHQRTRIAQRLGIDIVPCVEVNLDLEKEKELNIRLSKNTASIDDALLAVHFSKELLKNVGFREEELKMFLNDFEKQFNSITNANCAYPLVPKFSEKYDTVIIVSKNSIDTTYIENALKIEKSQSYKNQRTGKAMIIDVDKFRKVWENR